MERLAKHDRLTNKFARITKKTSRFPTPQRRFGILWMKKIRDQKKFQKFLTTKIRGLRETTAKEETRIIFNDPVDAFISLDAGDDFGQLQWNDFDD